MVDFKAVAKKATTLSDLMNDREQIKNDDLIKKYPDGVTITKFDVAVIDDKQFPVFIFKEDPTKFFNGGAILMKIVDEWIKSYDGDIDGASDDLASCGGIKIRLYSDKTKKGNNITRIEIL